MSKVDFSLGLSTIQTEYGRVSGKWFAYTHQFPGIEGSGNLEEDAKLDLVNKILDYIDRRTQEIMGAYMTDKPLDGEC